MSSDTKWTVKLRDDQMNTLIQTLDYVIETHAARANRGDVTGIDEFAHRSSLARLSEVRGHLLSIRGD